VIVCRAAETKSCVLIKVSRGGLESGEKEVETEGGGFAHSSVMDEGSREPMTLEECREFLMSEGAWISLYAVDASHPAYRKMMPAPPGCSGAKSVISYTVLSTTIHRSSGILCFEISRTEITRAMVKVQRSELLSIN